MATPLKLADLLVRDNAALAASGTLLVQKLFFLDGSGVAAITNEQLDALLGAVPTDWGRNELAEIIDLDSLSPAVAAQLADWHHRRTEGDGVPAPGQEGEAVGPLDVQPP